MRLAPRGLGAVVVLDDAGGPTPLPSGSTGNPLPEAAAAAAVALPALGAAFVSGEATASQLAPDVKPPVSPCWVGGVDPAAAGAPRVLTAGCGGEASSVVD